MLYKLHHHYRCSFAAMGSDAAPKLLSVKKLGQAELTWEGNSAKSC
jgi:hypothetical protein